MQEKRNSSALAIELRLSCTNQSISKPVNGENKMNNYHNIQTSQDLHNVILTQLWNRKDTRILPMENEIKYYLT